MLIPAFNLPSNPEKEIQMREATVADCIEMADVHEAREEAATSLFLKNITGENAKPWTADDRRFALLWYFIHTEKDHGYTAEYPCGHCGGRHSVTFDLKALLDTYTKIKGGPDRVVAAGDDRIKVTPLTGAAMEALELERIGIESIEGEHGQDSVEAQRARLQMRMNELLHKIKFLDQADDDEYVVTLGVSQMESILEAVSKAESEMVHGIDTVYDDGVVYLLSPPHQCPERDGEEAKTRCWVRFRNSHFIPKL